MEFIWWKNIFVVLIMSAVLVTGVYFAISINKNLSSGKIEPIKKVDAAVRVSSAPVVNPPPPPPQKLSNPPQIMQAVYVTGYSAGTKSYLRYLSGLINDTQINAVVIDVKGSDGYVTYSSGAGDVKKYNLNDDAISDIDSLIRFFHDQNIYVIGRIAVFEDPIYAKSRPALAIYDKSKTTDVLNPVLWKDNNGLAWLDPASKDVWDYDVSLAKDAFYHGFDEINFDYVRFPTDGKTGEMGFPAYDGVTPKADVIKNFFQYLRTQLAGDKISVDLFGQTTVSKDDMGIGQVIENAFENFDYVCPMVYPSHYANGFDGFKNPAEHPYDIIKYSMDTAMSRKLAYQHSQQASVSTVVPEMPIAKFRPWLQDFNMGAVYDAGMVDQEIKATQDSMGTDYVGYMLWNPSNIYTKDAVLKP